MNTSVRVNGVALDPSDYAATREAPETWHAALAESGWAWDQYLGMRYLEKWIGREDEAIDLQEAQRRRVFEIHEVKAVFASLEETECKVQQVIGEVLSLMYWGIPAYRLDGALRHLNAFGRVAQRPFRFASVKAALTYLVTATTPRLGAGPVRLDLAEERDEDRKARARAARRFVEFMPAKQSRVSSEHVKGEGAVNDVFDVQSAVAASGAGEDALLVIATDVGRWVKATGGKGVELVRVTLGQLAAELGVEREPLKARLSRARGRIEYALVARGMLSGKSKRVRPTPSSIPAPPIEVIDIDADWAGAA